MKKIFIIYALLSVSCGKKFIDRSSLDGTTVSNYYNTADEVRGATSTLYGLPWSAFENRAMDVIGDVMAGNMYSGGSDDAPYVAFSYAATSACISDAWKAFYKIGGWTSALIKTFEDKKGQGGNAAILDPAIAECHFLKGTVYFYIARIWGDAPIVNDPGGTALSGNFLIPRYLQKDVLRFVLEELQAAEAGLPENDVPGRVTKWSAKGMMAKVYLYMKDYENAKKKADEVMATGKYNLLDDYAALFNTSSNNNNVESLFAIQHQLTSNPWGSGNQKNPDRGPSNMQTDEAAMWQLYLPTIDLLNAYEPADKRRKGSVMEHGWTKSEWKPRNGNAAYNNFMKDGYKYDTLAKDGEGGILNETRSNVAKYVVGPGKAYGGETVLGMNTGINTMLLRYADVLLIYAEAVIGTNNSTTDSKAVEAYNKVRRRAGLPTKTTITKDDVLHERRIEFAFEGDYWFDVQRQGGAKAKQIVQAQNRGKVGEPRFVNFDETKNMYLPIPAGEILQDPELAKDPVPYY